jgi:hypothetical protein
MIADRPGGRVEASSFRGPGAFWRRLWPRRAVLDALAEVGEAGMTPNALEVTTELSEPQLNAVLHGLVESGLVTCRPAGGVTALRSGRYLLATHVGGSPGRISGPDRHR